MDPCPKCETMPYSAEQRFCGICGTPLRQPVPDVFWGIFTQWHEPLWSPSGPPSFASKEDALAYHAESLPDGPVTSKPYYVAQVSWASEPGPSEQVLDVRDMYRLDWDAADRKWTLHEDKVTSTIELTTLERAPR